MKSRFCISFGNQGSQMESRDGQNPSFWSSSVKVQQSVIVGRAMSPAVVGALWTKGATVN